MITYSTYTTVYKILIALKVLQTWKGSRVGVYKYFELSSASACAAQSSSQFGGIRSAGWGKRPDSSGRARNEPEGMQWWARRSRSGWRRVRSDRRRGCRRAAARAAARAPARCPRDTRVAAPCSRLRAGGGGGEMHVKPTTNEWTSNYDRCE